MKSTEMRYAVGIDFGGTSVKLALINERGQIKARRKFVTKDVQGHAGWLARVAQEVEALKAGEGTGIALAGVGVGVPDSWISSAASFMICPTCRGGPGSRWVPCWRKNWACVPVSTTT
jgi:predicted NBD/HSP70 family sugar kinase